MATSDRYGPRGGSEVSDYATRIRHIARISPTALHFGADAAPASMIQIPIQHQTKQISRKYETAATPPGGYAPPRISIFRLLRLQPAISWVVSTACPSFPPRASHQPPGAKNDMCRRTLQIRSKYEPAATPPDRYGSPRVGEVRLLRQESDIWRQSPPPVLHFRRRPTSRPHDPNGHVTPNATNKQEIRHRRNDSGPLRIPTDR